MSTELFYYPTDQSLAADRFTRTEDFQQAPLLASSPEMMNSFQPFADEFFAFEPFLTSQHEQLLPSMAAPPIVATPAATTVSPGQLSLPAPFHHYQQPTEGYTTSGYASSDYYVHRQYPSTRTYGYHPYGAPSRYSQQHQQQHWDESRQHHNHHHHHHQHAIQQVIDYNQANLFDYSNYNTLTVQPAQLCADPHSFEAHRTYSHSSSNEYTSLISSSSSSEPASPVSPYQSSKDDSDPVSSPSSTGQLSEVSIASASVSPKATLSQPNLNWSPLSDDSDKEDDAPVVSKKRANKSSASRRATRSVPEPAWVEAVLADDGSKQRTKSANRPIAFACVFCRHRKIQCIRPKMDLAPGERPAPCNQCEKRSRTCEYPPAVLNPRTVRRVKVSAKNDD